MLKKIAVISSAFLLLTGCAFLNQTKQKIMGPEVKPVVIEENSNTPQKPKRKKKRNQQAAQPSQVKEDAVINTNNGGIVVAEENYSLDTSYEEVEESANTSSETPTELIEEETNEEANANGSCSYSSNEVLTAVKSLAKQAVMSYQPRQPNLSMVYYVTTAKDVCYSGTSLTSVLKNEIEQSGRYNLIPSSLEQRIKSQIKQASNAYMIRIAKSQNVDYVLSGSVLSNGKNATVMLKITDLRTGSVVWQRSELVK